MSARYVVYCGRRYAVLGETDLDSAPALELRSATPRSAGQHLAVAIVAPAAECREDKRHARFRGYKPHRNGRPIVLDVRQEHGEIHVELRPLGKRKGFTTTIEGLFDMAARQGRGERAARAHVEAAAAPDRADRMSARTSLHRRIVGKPLRLSYSQQERAAAAWRLWAHRWPRALGRLTEWPPLWPMRLLPLRQRRFRAARTHPNAGAKA